MLIGSRLVQTRLVREGDSFRATAVTAAGGGSVAFDAATSISEESGDGLISLSHTASGSNRAAFAGVAIRDIGTAANSTGCTYNGQAMTELWDTNFNATTLCNAGYSLANSLVPAGASTVISDADQATILFHALIVATFTGVNQSAPVGTPNTATGTASPATVTVASVNPEDYVVDSMTSASDPATEGANQTMVDSESDAAGDFRSYCSIQDGADGGVMSYTFTAVDAWGIGAVAFKPA
jgi:hypothetical protein